MKFFHPYLFSSVRHNDTKMTKTSVLGLYVDKICAWYGFLSGFTLYHPSWNGKSLKEFISKCTYLLHEPKIVE